MNQPRRNLLLIGLAAIGLSACERNRIRFHNTDVSGAEFGKGFALTDHLGQPRTLADYRGKVVTIFFGYTQCPDVCPTTLAEMAEVMKLLGERAGKVQVLFVTLDPERDTEDLLARYVPAFDPRFIGLFGSVEDTARVAREFKVFHQKVSGATPDSYTIDHSAGSYVFDQNGRLRLFVKHGQGAQPLADDIRALLDGG